MTTSPVPSEHAPRKGTTPPGWSYNPSGTRRRVAIAALACAGFILSAYLAAAQAGLISRVWDPLFAAPSPQLLLAWGAPRLHITPAWLGALIMLSYLFVVVTTCIGDTTRYRNLPWMVMLFGVAVGPLGALVVLYTLLQPVVFEAWCTLRLATAVISLAIMALSLDEVLASAQYLRRAAGREHALWQAFWGRSKQRATKPSREVRHVGAL
jgi:hypothetical protein